MVSNIFLRLESQKKNKKHYFKHYFKVLGLSPNYYTINHHIPTCELSNTQDSPTNMRPCPHVRWYFHKQSSFCAVCPFVQTETDIQVAENGAFEEKKKNSFQGDDFQKTLLGPVAFVWPHCLCTTFVCLCDLLKQMNSRRNQNGASFNLSFRTFYMLWINVHDERCQMAFLCLWNFIFRCNIQKNIVFLNLFLVLCRFCSSSGRCLACMFLHLQVIAPSLGSAACV